MRGNTISIQMETGKICYAGGVFQYDRGQRLVIGGCELPETYQVHFSNDETGTSKTMIGDRTGVDIPDEYLQSGKDVHVYVYVVGQDHAETEYHGVILVTPRTKPTNATPIPAQKTAIDRIMEQMTGYTEENRKLAQEIRELAGGLPIPDTIANQATERAVQNVLWHIGTYINTAVAQALASCGLYFDDNGDLCQTDEEEEANDGETDQG